MGLHYSQESMLKESLADMLDGAGLCIKHRKNNGGCLGYPACLLLLSIADAIASYHEGDKSFKIKVDGKERIISRKDHQRFYIFNSHYYNFSLSENFIKKIYNNYRCLLVHNATLPNDHFINIDHPLREPFDEDGWKDELTGEKYPSISLKPLWEATAIAVSKFLTNIDSILPKSNWYQNIDSRKK